MEKQDGELAAVAEEKMNIDEAKPGPVPTPTVEEEKELEEEEIVEVTEGDP